MSGYAREPEVIMRMYAAGLKFSKQVDMILPHLTINGLYFEGS